jgi:hypothetical protein
VDLFALATLAARADEAGGPSPTKFHELRDNLVDTAGQRQLTPTRRTVRVRAARRTR